jgi:hypothetical protein
MGDHRAVGRGDLGDRGVGALCHLTLDGRRMLSPLLFHLRRRRYGTSHGVGLLHRLAGLEGTYAVALTAPALFTAVLRRDQCRVDRREAALPGCRSWPFPTLS